MKLIAQHPYIKVERKVTGLEQVQIEHSRVIYLYEDKIVTQYRQFGIDAVMDISFKAVASQGGMLYVHTLHGVYMYQVKTSPIAFITAYKAHFK